MKVMRVESSEADCLLTFRIVKYRKGRFGVEVKEYDEWVLMGGGLGIKDAVFDTYEEAEQYLEKGLKEEKDNPDIWLTMLETDIENGTMRCATIIADDTAPTGTGEQKE